MENCIKCVLFDWGNTLMRCFPEFHGPMHAWPKVEVIPGAEKMLAQISDGRIIGLATNAADSTEPEIRNALCRVSLNSLINKIYCFRNIGSPKPSRGFFEHILHDLSLGPGEIAIVGDDFERDIVGANSHGIYGFWLNMENSQRRIGRMHDTIYTLRDLPDALARRELHLREKAAF